MKNILLILLYTVFLLSSCSKNPIVPIEKNGQISFKLKTKNIIEVKTRSNTHENDMNNIYLIVFDGTSNLFIECKPTKHVGENSYTSILTPIATSVKIVAIANLQSLIETKMSSWTAGTTTYEDVFNDLLTNELTANGGNIIAMPELPPMSGEMQLNKIEKTMTIANPFLMERATAKITISSTASNFNIIGVNMYNAPTKGYAMPNQSSTNLLAIPRANYVGSDGHGGYGPEYMISTATLTDPLYCYEIDKHTDNTKHPYLIINSNRGFYRINLTDKNGMQLSLQRNYYYKINISKIINDGALTAEKAVTDATLNADVVVNDPDSHEIISDGVNYLGLTNSEYIIYDSYALHEFNRNAENNRHGVDYESINGYDVATLTYKSNLEGEVICTEFTTQSGTGTFKFQNSLKCVWDTKLTIEDEFGWNNLTEKLTLPASPNSATSKKIIINIPHDFVRAKLKVNIGALEKQITIERNEIISYMGDILDMGSGFSTASIDFEEDFKPLNYSPYTTPFGYPIPAVSRGTVSDVIGFSTSQTTPYSKNLIVNPSDNLFVKVNPLGGNQNIMYEGHPIYDMRASEFYLTREANQSRVRVHLIQEPFMNGITDSPYGAGAPYENFGAAFWRNNEVGERIIFAPTTNSECYWTARVIYGEDFIRLSQTDDSRTSEYGRPTTGNPEDYKPDDTWKTYLQMPFRKGTAQKTAYPKFRIALTGVNPNPAKPRYGLVAFMAAPFVRTGQTFLVFVRQGEEPDYLFSPTDTYNGAPRTYAQAFSPYNLTVPDPENHPGGANFSDHKMMTQEAVFTQYPTQQGYLYQWGNDIAIHPDNPTAETAIIDYTYDYNASYKNICPNGYTLARTDELRSVFNHSFRDPLSQRETMGLCADGYYDRVEHERNNSVYSVGSGPKRGAAGDVYYNTKTRASIFTPYSSNRIEATGTNPTRDNILSWAVIDGLTGDKQGTVLINDSYLPTNNFLSDRQRALSIRCVKTTP